MYDNAILSIYNISTQNNLYVSCTDMTSVIIENGILFKFRIDTGNTIINDYDNTYIKTKPTVFIKNSLINNNIIVTAGNIDIYNSTIVTNIDPSTINTIIKIYDNTYVSNIARGNSDNIDNISIYNNAIVNSVDIIEHNISVYSNGSIIKLIATQDNAEYKGYCNVINNGYIEEADIQGNIYLNINNAIVNSANFQSHRGAITIQSNGIINSLYVNSPFSQYQSYNQYNNLYLNNYRQYFKCIIRK